MSRLASVTDYQREIAAVEGLIAEQEAQAEEHGLDFATELTIRSLRERRNELNAKLAAMTDEGLPGHELSVVVRGTPVENHSIEAEFLGRLLQDVQKLVRALVASQYGDRRRQGAWRPTIRRRSTLRFSEAFAGSFGMTLEAVDEQMELEGHLAIQPAFNDLFEVLGAVLDGGSFLDRLAPLGPRARSHLRAMLEHIGASDADVEFHWPLIAGEKLAAISSRRAQSMAETLRRIDESDRLETILGLLEGAILRTGYFEVIKDSGEVVSGRVSPDLHTKLAPHFNTRVSATVIVTTIRDRGTDETKVSYRLVDLEPAPDQQA